MQASPRVLLVDDEQEFVDTLAKRLRARDFEVAVAYEGVSALAHVDRYGCDVMLLDLKMPGLDGIEVLRRLKQRHPRVEVVILSGHGAACEERAARALGAFEYLSKPTEIDRLTETLMAAYLRAVEPAA